MVGQAFRWRYMARVSEAVLTALHHYIQHGGGSRGARAICSDMGPVVQKHLKRSGAPLVEEQERIAMKLFGLFKEDQFVIDALPVDLSPDAKREFLKRGGALTSLAKVDVPYLAVYSLVGFAFVLCVPTVTDTLDKVLVSLIAPFKTTFCF